MSFLRDLFYAMAIGRMTGTLVGEHLRRAREQREAETRSMPPAPQPSMPAKSKGGRKRG